MARKGRLAGRRGESEMPTRKTEAARYPWQRLSAGEKLRLHGIGGLPSEHSGCLTTMEAVRQAWFQNRDLLMRLRDFGERTPWAYDPGTRPWGFWVCELGLEGTPKNERRELEKRGLLTHQERVMLREQARKK